jgi:hypothetical protein
MARTTSSGIASPVPAACDRTIERCNSSAASRSIRTFASAPNPVVIP